MRLLRRPLLILLVGMLAGATVDLAPAWAAADGKPQARMKIIRARPLADLDLRPTVNLRQPSAPSLPPPGQPGAGFTSAGFASGSLAQNGLRSGLPVLGDPSAQCRTACTQSRITCDAQDAAPECSPRWATCIAGCPH
jgi:hypothetical protein